MVGGSMHILNIYWEPALFSPFVKHNELPFAEVKKPGEETVDKPEGGAAKDKEAPLTSS